MKCTNKVYLADLLRMRKIPAPDTRILLRQPQARTMASLAGLSFPMVLKIPDGSFSKGVVKVRNEDELQEALERSQIPPPRKLGQTLISEGMASPKDVSRALRKQAQQVTDSNTIRVDIKKLDDLIDMVGELVITQSMIRQSDTLAALGDRKLVRDISQLASITSELQRSSTVLRMIPIKQTFQRMSRLVRDLSKNSGKLVNVVTVGEDTEIDRNMVDEIYNPLVHMIRNAVDHGMEMPEDRIQAGKPERGTIRLKAFHRGGNIVIEISDDGRGLNREKSRQKAVKNGLINAADALTDPEVNRLILLPGCSTAEKITDISGRGVGMDVVKQAVEKLRGKMDIQSNPQTAGKLGIRSIPALLFFVDGVCRGQLVGSQSKDKILDKMQEIQG